MYTLTFYSMAETQIAILSLYLKKWANYLLFFFQFCNIMTDCYEKYYEIKARIVR